MHDIRLIRENPALFDAALARRGLPALADEMVSLDCQRRALQTEIQSLQSRRNEASKQIGALKAKGEDASALIDEVAQIKAQAPAKEAEEATLAEALQTHLMSLPNILDDSVPQGDDEEDNALIREVGVKPDFDFTPKDHVTLGENLGQMDFATAANLSGARFVLLKGQ